MPHQDHIQLYGPPESTYVHTVRTVLEAKFVPYTLHNVDLFKGETRSPSYRANHHPFAKVPVLYHNDVHLFETCAITRYLDRVFPTPPLSPPSPAQEASMIQWMSVVDNYLYPTLQREIVWFEFFAPKFGFPENPKVLAKAQKKTPLLLQTVEDLIGSSTFLLGDQWTLLDAHFAPILHCASFTPTGQSALQNTPNLSRWLRTMQALPPFASTIGPMFEITSTHV